MQKTLFVLMLALLLSVSAFGDSIIYEEDFSAGIYGWEEALWDDANERAITASDNGIYYADIELWFSPKENWVISYDLIVANTLTDFDPDKVLPSFYNSGTGAEYELYFTNADISVTEDSDYTTYSYIVDAGENYSGLAAGYWSDTTDIGELLTKSYGCFYLNFNFDANFCSCELPGATNNVYVDNVKIIAKSNVIPEPATLAYAAMGLASIAGIRRFKK